MTVWNVTDQQVVVRGAIVDENVAPTGTTATYRGAKREPPSVAEKNGYPPISTPVSGKATHHRHCRRTEADPVTAEAPFDGLRVVSPSNHRGR